MLGLVQIYVICLRESYLLWGFSLPLSSVSSLCYHPSFLLSIAVLNIYIKGYRWTTRLNIGFHQYLNMSMFWLISRHILPQIAVQSFWLFWNDFDFCYIEYNQRLYILRILVFSRHQSILFLVLLRALQRNLVEDIPPSPPFNAHTGHIVWIMGCMY